MELLVERESGDRGDDGSNQEPEMRERDWGFERRSGLIEMCHFLKFDLPRRMGMLH